MTADECRIDTLISLPPGMADQLADCEPRTAQRCFAAADPVGCQLGSGGGTAHLLSEAWQATGDGLGFGEWLNDSRKLMIHGGGRSRRLPAYAATGKLFVPVPAYRWSLGHRIDQTLLDLQEPFLGRVCAQASPASRLLIASGDVLLRSDEPLPPLPDADVVLLGLWTTPEEAQDFGVLFSRHNDPSHLVTFLQKPTPDRIREMAGDYIFMVDVGVWLLSEKAVRLLMTRSGWDCEAQAFRDGAAEFYDLYGEWGLHLGESPCEPDEEISALTTAVVPVPGGGFYHFGKSRDVIESVYRLQNLVIDQTQLGALGRQPHPKQFCQNALFGPALRQAPNHSLWVENSHIPATWKIASEHVLTGVPDNDWSLRLERGVCLDFVPVGDSDYALRVYGIDDPFRGRLEDGNTLWLGRPARSWFADRGIDLEGLGIGASDIQDAPLFPVMSREALAPDFIEWLFAAEPCDADALRQAWCGARRLSATELGREIRLDRLYEQRRERVGQVLPRMVANYNRSIFHKLDLEATAELYAAGGNPLPDEPVPFEEHDPLIAVHDRMFRAAVLRARGDGAQEGLEREAFGLLRQAVVNPIKAHPVVPRLNVLEDQIIWGRCPVRLDIAGGWSDTPPYCFERGGQVVNMAVDLNGQPPIQVFARRVEAPELVIRSIDLGIEERLHTYDDVQQYGNLASGFTIARAAFALAGFDPAFNGERFDTLREQLLAFGGGIEISMLAAVPKGSGLGTSSILAATLLGTLSDFAGLRWDRFEVSRRTVALEQMLTSGGGWQDQIGGVFHGAKLIETTPGLEQDPTMRWLPGRFFADTELNGRMLLYYTGITRVAHNILAEIVRGIFLNGRRHLEIVDEIRETARFAYDAVLRDDVEGFAEAVGRSWNLNNRLDSGTNVPGVQAILDRCGSDLRSAKLLGAGGGGYLLMIAESAAGARSIREKLASDPPNAKARFVDFSLSETGLQITRS